MWFMIPTPPYLVDGVERGSARNRRFALRSEEEVRDYLRRPLFRSNFPHDLNIFKSLHI